MDITFAELPLGSKLQAAITAAGYTVPTPIQAQAIPIAVTGRDVLGIAQTGTGKTASFVLPMIQRLEDGRARARMPRSLILAPTRELAAQVAQSFEKYGINHKLDVALLIGGVSMDDQVKKLDRGVDVLIATPGRLLDHFQRGRIMLMGAEILVIDEADRMLDMGFIPDIEKICKLLPPRRQTLFFSATMPTEIKRLVDTFLSDPVRIEVARPATTAKTITQRFRFCPSSEEWEKREILRELIHSNPVKNAIIFCNRKRDVAILHKSLVKHGFNAGALHGDMEQRARMETLDKFRNGEIMLLAASDVAARGLDIPDVSHVFNFDIPWAGDDYVHRIGRTGRAGKEGASLSLVTPEDLKLIKDIEKVTGEVPTWIGEPPSEADFAEGGKRRRGGRRGESAGADRDGRRGAGRGEGRSAAPGAGRGEARGAARGEARGAARGEARGAARGEARGAARSEARGAPRGEARPGRAEGRRVTAAGEGSASGRVEGRRRGSARLEQAGAVPEVIGGADKFAATPDAGPLPVGPVAEAQRDSRGASRREHRSREAIPGMGEQPAIGRSRPEQEGSAPARGRPQRREHGERHAERGGAGWHGAERHTSETRPTARRERQAEGFGDRVERPVREPRARRPESAEAGVGFADNVPAFLRRPVRPKVANE